VSHRKLALVDLRKLAAVVDLRKLAAVVDHRKLAAVVVVDLLVEHRKTYAFRVMVLALLYALVL
jgi:hypothetical protein